MQHFFTTDPTKRNCAIIDFQRRACWIGLAILLQAISEPVFFLIRGLNEIYRVQIAYSSILLSLGFLLSFSLIIGSFLALWMAFRPGIPWQDVAEKIEIPSPRRWQRFILVCCLLLALVGSVLVVWSVVTCFLPAQLLNNDGTLLDANAARLLLQGRDPYTDSNFPDIAKLFVIHPDLTTPLRSGQFLNRLDYPSIDELGKVLTADLKAGQTPEFESKVSYPAFSFLTLVPFVLVNSYNVVLLYVLGHILLVVIAWKVSQPELRPWVMLLALANITTWGSTVGDTLDMLYMLFITLTWLSREQRWSSALFLGLAIATKQPAWFFLPFYLIMVWRNQGLKEAMLRLGIAGSLALLINLPFILWNPQAWLAGVLAPVVDPMFPLGTGLIGLSTAHLLPYLPTTLYSALELGTLLVCLVYYWHICREHPEAAMLLAVLPLFFAWRSLPSYFYCAAFPIIVLMAAKRFPAYLPVLPSLSRIEDERQFLAKG